MTQVLGFLVLSTVRCFCIAQKQKGVADAMIEAHFLKIYIIPTKTRCCNLTSTSPQQPRRTRISEVSQSAVCLHPGQGVLSGSNQEPLHHPMWGAALSKGVLKI